MDTYIQKVDFLKIKDEDQEDDFRVKMEEHFEDWEPNKFNTKMVINSIQILVDKACIEKFPPVESFPANSVVECLEQIFRIMDRVVENEKGKYSELHEPCYEFILKLINTGPNTLPIKLIETIIQNYELEFKEYFQSLKEDKVKRYLKAFKRSYSPRDGFKDKEEYADQVEQMIDKIFDLIEDDDNIKYIEEFFELNQFFKSGEGNTEKHLREKLLNMCDVIERKFDGNMLKAKGDMTYVKLAIQDLINMVKDKDLPKTKEDTKLMTDNFDLIKESIEQTGNFEACYDKIMDYVMVLVTKKPDENVKKVLDEIGYYFFHVDEETNKILKNEKLFPMTCKRMIELLKSSPPQEFLEVKLMDALASEILVKSMNYSKDHVKLAVELISLLVKNPTLNCANATYQLLREKEKAFKWLDYIPQAKDIFKAISSVQVKDKEVIKEIVNYTEYFLDQLKKCKALGELNDSMVEFSVGCLESRNVQLFKLGAEVSERCTFSLKTNKDLIFENLKKFIVLFNDPDFPWLDTDASDSTDIANHIVNPSIEALDNQGKKLTTDDRTVLIDLTLSVIDKDFLNPYNQEPGNIFYYTTHLLSYKLFDLLDAGKELDRVEPVIPHFFNFLESDEEGIVDLGQNAIFYIAQKSAKPFAPELDKLIVKLLELENSNLMSAVHGAYDFNPEPVKKHFKELFSKLSESGDTGLKSYFFMFLEKVAKTQPELFTDENAKKLITLTSEDKPNDAVILRVLIELAKRKPEKLSPHTEACIKLMDQVNDYSIYFVCNVLKFIGMSNEKKGDLIMTAFIKKFKTCEDSTQLYGLIDGMKHVGSKFKPLLEKHKAVLEAKKKSTSDQTIKDQITSMIDWLEGRTIQGFMEGIESLQDDVVQLDSRVTTNENNVNEVKEDVKNTKKDVGKVKKDVKKQGKKLDSMGRVVDDTVKKVEEIDQKTLSHAPYWSKDISKLLNPKDEHDWRLLASRLGYSKDDIRAWSQQSDPCMAMLNEWYTTHKTSEANFGILNNLVEMDRMDAAVIVENAMKAAEQVVEDDDYDYPVPPPIFISYQWGHQDEVRLLKQHLDMAGYDCWMDIGQMGGGDKLFEKIDRGIRGAKVIISCTTEKYAKSPNCNREVTLSVNLRKPIIPLLLESCPWPPEGSMGPIFSEYLYIQFYQSNKSDETKDERFWPPPKFQELLMQLSMNGIVPDESKVHKMYKNWWNPLVEEIKIDKSKTANGGKNNKQVAKTDTKKQDDKSPDVFISYQWDKQKNIMLLYKKLTELGYDCWMDIYQMGGGDSLYDKIDRGIRGCKVVLSCLTEKYTLSANCRREVSLCDSLKRPIIPLLLENMSWPPRGPMSMAFTELLYIDLHSDTAVQEKWSGPKFEEMKSKIEHILPSDVTNPTEDNEKPAADSKNNPKAAKLAELNKKNSSKNTPEDTPQPKPEEKPPQNQPKPQEKPPQNQPKPQEKPPQNQPKPQEKPPQNQPKPQEKPPQNQPRPQVKRFENEKTSSYVKKATPGSKVKKDDNKLAREVTPEATHTKESPSPQSTNKSTPEPKPSAASPEPAKSKSCHIL